MEKQLNIVIFMPTIRLALTDIGNLENTGFCPSQNFTKPPDAESTLSKSKIVNLVLKMKELKI